MKKNKETYLQKNTRNGLYKIGRSINPRIREKTLQGEDPDINMVWTYPHDIETHLHNMYSRQRVRGEWFSLTKLQVRFICTKDWSDVVVEVSEKVARNKVVKISKSSQKISDEFNDEFRIMLGSKVNDGKISSDDLDDIVMFYAKNIV